ncbi:MAG TPA: DMT family transporter [Pyrinomonadaceae bacterium]|nr:DMT family transporter [Pyrinomonadaceae bacterium]
MRVALYTVFALVAFAFNSILCRLALRGDEADAASFTGVRLVSGAITLLVISYLSKRKVSYFFTRSKTNAGKGNWPAAIYLFAYAICFSLAYLQLTAGTGALILFGSVQLTMVAVSLVRGERPRTLEWLGLGTALFGLVYLVLPGLASPPLNSSLLMAAAGAAWGLYTLRGRGSGDPLADTTGNFVRTLPFAAIAVIAFLPNLHLSNRGIMLAVLSGAVASGIGYTVWYAALKHHTAARAAVLQLAVPVLTGVIGVIFLTEAASQRLAIAAALILGGIGLTILGRKRS